MFPLSIYLIGLIILPYGLSCAQQIYKCCPKNNSILTSHLFDETSCESMLMCKEMKEWTNETLLNNSHYGLFTNNSDIPSQQPLCSPGDKPHLHSLEEMAVVELSPNSSCVDLVSGEFTVVTCNAEAKSRVEVYSLRKCCPVDFVFNREWSKCRPRNKTFATVPVSPFWPEEPQDIQLIKSLINEFDMTHNHVGVPLFHIGVPKCDADDVLIEYQLKTHEFHLDRNRIIPRSNIFGERNLNVFLSQPSDPFCIDSVAPSTLHPPEDPSDHTNITWTVRVCRPRSICNHIPCIRKCCRNNEMLAKRENQTICVPFEKDLLVTFHDLEDYLITDSISEEPKQVHVSGE